MQCYIQIHITQKLRKCLWVQMPIHHHQNPQKLYQIWSCSTPNLQLRFGNTWHPDVCSYQETCPRNSFHMSWKSSSGCGENGFEKSLKEVLKRQVSKTCLALAALYGMNVRQRTWEMKNRNKVLILSSSLCSVAFQYFIWEKTYKHWCITFQTPFVNFHATLGRGRQGQGNWNKNDWY